MNRIGSILTVAAVAVGLLAPPAHARARAVKNTVTGTVNGKHLRWKGRYVLFTTNESGVFVIATKPARPGGILRTIGFACPVILTGQTFPFTPDPTNCTGSYQEMRVSRHPSIKAWHAGIDGVQVTYATFDGTVVTGTFSAVYTPLSGSAETVTVQGQFQGKFSQGS